jgi:hypothetical protein
MAAQRADQPSFWKWTAVSVGILAAITLVALTTGVIAIPERAGPKETFLDWYCGVTILKLFGLQTDIYRHRAVGSPNSDLHPTLTRSYTVGFMPHELTEGTHAYANPPCYFSHAHAADLASAQDYIIRQLRALNATASASSRPRVFANALHGPFVALLANNNSLGQIHIVLYAPSHSRDGLVQPNYDALGRAHRWLYRLLTANAYTIPDPLFYSTNGSLSHVRTCIGAREETRDVGACSTLTTYAACGCLGPGCSPRFKFPGNAKLQKAQQVAIYVAYEIRLDHPAISALVSREAGSPRALLRNILPSIGELRAGMAGALVSPNGAYAALLTARGGLRVNGVLALPSPSGRIAGSVTIDGKNLTLQTVENSPIAEMVVAEGNIKGPVTLVLKSNGQLAAYDATNADVTSAAVKSVNAAIREADPKAGADGSGYDVDPLAPWDPAADYRWRIEQLLNYLRLRNLLFNYDVSSDVIDKSALFGALGQSAGQQWGTYDVSAMPPYDPSVNYTERLLALAAVLRKADLNVPSDAELLATTSFSVKTSLGKKETVDASSPLWGQIVSYEAATTNRYNPDVEYQKRLAAAFG